MDENVGQGQSGLDRRKVLLGLGLVGVAGLAQARMPVPDTPPTKKKDFEALISDRIGDFTFNTESGLVLPPPDALSARLYDSIITRTYSDPAGRVVMLLIAYNNKQDGLLQLHRPEICYPAGGYELTPVDPIAIPVTRTVNLPGQIFAARSDERNEVVLYWTRVGDQFPRKWAEQRWSVAKANLRGVIPDGILVRVSTLAAGMAEAVPTLLGFSRGLHDASAGRARTLMFGNT